MQAKAILNVGLNVGPRTERAFVNAAVRNTLRMIRGSSGFPVAIAGAAEVASDTEPTLVLSLTRPLNVVELERLSQAALQDAVSQYQPATQHGDLAGPRAADWGGKFLGEFFFLPDGSRLGSVDHAQAA